MIQMTFADFNDKTNEGKMLLAAMAILTSIDFEDIKSGRFGGMTHPEDAFKSVVDIANKIYYEDEYKLYLKSLDRDKKVSSIIDPTNL